jgi:hypothetical protein
MDPEVEEMVSEKSPEADGLIIGCNLHLNIFLSLHLTLSFCGTSGSEGCEVSKWSCLNLIVGCLCGGTVRARDTYDEREGKG